MIAFVVATHGHLIGLVAHHGQARVVEHRLLGGREGRQPRHVAAPS